jgi:carboxyl-terminal processing protease
VRRAVALSAVMAIAGACGAIVGPGLPATPIAEFDRVWRDLDLHYSFFALKKTNWDSLGAVYRPRAVAAHDDGELAPIVLGLLGNLRDRHISLTIGGNTSSPDTESQGSTFDPLSDYQTYVRLVGSFSGGPVSYGFATPTVGYLEIQTFEGSGWLAEIDTALAGLPGIHGLIVDVRHNNGGLVENAIAVAGRFADRSLTFASVRFRNGPSHSDFSSPTAQRVVPAGVQHFSGNVYLLTNRNTYSAAELFVLAMRALGHTTTVGDTTGGQAGSPLVRELQNGWTYQFPESIEYTLGGTTFEDIGLPPDAPIQRKQSDINNGVDTQIERALALAASH